MKEPKMILYLDELGISRLHEQIEGGTLVEVTGSSASEDLQKVTSGFEAGGGFLSILNLARLSLRGSKAKKKSAANEQRHAVGSYAHLGLVVNALKSKAPSRYFESLDTAYESAAEADDGCSWICIKDKFSLVNVGASLSFEVLNREQRFVFEIDPSRHAYIDKDDYFKMPKRPWRLTMSASFERCPRLKGRSFGVSSHEALYFRMYNYMDVPLNVFGCYLKNQLQVTVIPYAIWV